MPSRRLRVGSGTMKDPSLVPPSFALKSVSSDAVMPPLPITNIQLEFPYFQVTFLLSYWYQSFLPLHPSNSAMLPWWASCPANKLLCTCTSKGNHIHDPNSYSLLSSIHKMIKNPRPVITKGKLYSSKYAHYRKSACAQTHTHINHTGSPT